MNYKEKLGVLSSHDINTHKQIKKLNLYKASTNKKFIPWVVVA
jgi:hypothetical protein